MEILLGVILVIVGVAIWFVWEGLIETWWDNIREKYADRFFAYLVVPALALIIGFTVGGIGAGIGIGVAIVSIFFGRYYHKRGL